MVKRQVPRQFEGATDNIFQSSQYHFCSVPCLLPFAHETSLEGGLEHKFFMVKVGIMSISSDKALNFCSIHMDATNTIHFIPYKSCTCERITKAYYKYINLCIKFGERFTTNSLTISFTCNTTYFI